MNDVKLIGVKELEAQLGRINKSLDNAAKQSLLNQAEMVRDKIREKAPEGPTGNLKRSPVAKLLSSRSGYPFIAIAGIDRKIAPHAHLVEFGGSNIRTPKKTKVLFDKDTGQFFGTEVSPMPAHPFFRPAIQEAMPKAYSNLVEDLKKGVEKEV